MNYRRLGKSELEVSALAMGVWQFADTSYWGDEGNADAAVRAAIDCGINLFDAAEGYAAGESERALGKALGASRDKVLVATKVSPGHCEPTQLRASCEGSLDRLGTDWIDIYQVHWPCRDVPFEDAYGELLRLKQEGKIREIAVSNFGPQDIEAWMTVGDAVSNQLGYNLLFRAVEFEILPACVRHGLGVLVYMPVLQGILTDRWQAIDDIPMTRRRTRHFAADREGVRHGEPGHEDLLVEALAGLRTLAVDLGQPMATLAIAWALAKEPVASVLVGGRKPEQIERNLAAVDLKLPAEALERMDAITGPLKAALGANADMWMGADKSRIR